MAYKLSFDVLRPFNVIIVKKFIFFDDVFLLADQLPSLSALPCARVSPHLTLTSTHNPELSNIFLNFKKFYHSSGQFKHLINLLS